MSANETQVGGDHYKKSAILCPKCGHPIEHWDIAWALKWNNFVYAITKYLWRDKNGIEDLRKAKHCLDKYIEVSTAEDPYLSRANRLHHTND